ncbi:MAG: hypothetical protein J6L98_04235 [Bacteroidales bacterium]|nr:hypothetical protein [Bacteroidales bacterium]
MMRRILGHIAILFGVIAAFMAVSCREEDAPVRNHPATLTVKVVDEEANPVQSAEVKVGISWQGVTDSEGICVFKEVREGSFKVTVKAHDFIDYEKDVLISAPSASCLVSLSSVAPYLQTDSLQVRTSMRKGTCNINLRSNTDWKLVNDSPELKFSRTEGHGDQIVTCSWDFKVDSLVDIDALEAFFSVRSATERLDFSVRLAVPIRITRTYGVAGNHIKNPEGVCRGLVSFSRKVKNVKVFLGYQFMDVERIDDFTFSFPFHTNSYIFSTGNVDLVMAESANGDGVTFKENNVKVPFNDKVVYLEGSTVGLELSRDEKSMWTSVYGNKLRKIDARTLEVLKEIDVPFQPGPLSFNPYNGLLYVIDSYQGNGKSVKVIDPESGNLVKSIVIEPDEDDIFHNDTTITPWKIKFADNGVGAVLVTGNKLRIIDSRDGDKVSGHPYFDQEFDPNFNSFDHNISDITLDHTGTRFITLGLWNRVFILNTEDGGGEHFILHSHLGGDSGGGHIWIFKPHPQKPLLYITMPYCEGTYDMAAQTYTPPFNPTPGWNSLGDFCYGSPFGDDVCTYLYVKNPYAFFMIQDHTTGEVVYHTDIGLNSFIEGLIAFQEGDRILIYENSLDKTLFIQFNTSRFWN